MTGTYSVNAPEQRTNRERQILYFQCVLNKISCISLFLSHLSADDFKIHKALESKILHKHTPKYLKSLFLKNREHKSPIKNSLRKLSQKVRFELNT